MFISKHINEDVVLPNNAYLPKFLYIISETDAHCRGMSIDYKDLRRLYN